MKPKWIGVAASFAFLVCGQASLTAQETAAPGKKSATDKKTAPDNTKVNKSATPTADQAGNKSSDLDTMKKIRKAVMDDKSLSTYAHNVKIVSHNGKVTLKGPVRSEEEKATIERLATDVAGAGNVTNEITVKPASKKTSSKTTQK